VRKLISSPAVHFKGTGWYITDYGRKGAAASGRGDKDSGGKDAGKPASGTTPADKESGGKAARTGDSAKKPDRKR
jgi:hypothetical protein